MNVFIVCGSGRKDSNSQRFTNYLTEQLLHLGITRINAINFEHADIPMVGKGELQLSKLTPFQAELITGWESADLVFLVVPEYNWTTNGEFINALHQLGIPDLAPLFSNKVFAIAGVSAGRGGRRPALDVGIIVNKLINFLDQYAIVSPRIYESHETHVNLNAHGQDTGNHVYAQSVRAFAEYSVNLAKRWFGK